MNMLVHTQYLVLTGSTFLNTQEVATVPPHTTPQQRNNKTTALIQHIISNYRKSIVPAAESNRPTRNILDCNEALYAIRFSIMHQLFRER